jgi:dsRNA-specific ribonuclease
LQKFENLDDIFVKLIGAINIKNYTDRILNWIYKVLVMSLEKIDQMDLQSWLNELQNLFQVLERIHAAEMADRQKEWDPEQWLEQILSDKY